MKREKKKQKVKDQITENKWSQKVEHFKVIEMYGSFEEDENKR